ncbi:MAG: M48 family metallopeptidase [Syntrophales bacterium]|jgi:predicted Zn-dependent protease|nr:M48 family metallopeptidase [Syntrophales bacterium]MDY0044255.1 M48 family metallopeptidase [Syntrophales bacterium]
MIIKKAATERFGKFLFIMQSAALVFFLFACQTVPVTGREQLSLIPSQQITALSQNQYQEFIASHQVVQNKSEAKMVKDVGMRIKNAVETYLSENGMSDRIEGYNWEFNLIDEPSRNAWAMPGGKVVIYTGILPVTRNETGLATVMGHEIAHVVAGHGNERMSQALLTQLGGQALQAALSTKPQLTQQLFMAAFGLGAQVGVLLPYSRLQEKEADHLGLIFMAMAGYNPRAAVDFWQRMMAAESGASPPQFLSTHPAGPNRIDNIQEIMPEALSYYKR